MAEMLWKIVVAVVVIGACIAGVATGIYHADQSRHIEPPPEVSFHLRSFADHTYVVATRGASGVSILHYEDCHCWTKPKPARTGIIIELQTDEMDEPPAREDAGGFINDTSLTHRD